MQPTRRRLLVLAAQALPAGLLAGCGLLDRSPARPTPRPSQRPQARRPDPLLALLAAERRLLGAYDDVLTRHPQLLARLAAVRADHAAHLDALRALTADRELALPSPTPASSSPPPASAGTALASLRAAEGSAAARTAAACLAAPSSQAALLGSIAACESAHLVLLR